MSFHRDNTFLFKMTGNILTIKSLVRFLVFDLRAGFLTSPLNPCKGWEDLDLLGLPALDGQGLP